MCDVHDTRYRMQDAKRLIIGRVNEADIACKMQDGRGKKNTSRECVLHIGS
jgi:hypothetical protein